MKYSNHQKVWRDYHGPGPWPCTDHACNDDIFWDRVEQSTSIGPARYGVDK